MNSELEKSSHKKRKYILGLLLLLLIFIVWELTKSKSSIELIPEKEDRLKSVQPNIISDTAKTILNKKNTKERKPSSLKPKKKKEVLSTVELKKEPIVPSEKKLKKEIKTYKINKTIDARAPIVSNVPCKTTTSLKLKKASHQTSLAFSPDGDNFVVGNNNDYASIMNMKGKELFKLIGHKANVLSTAYSHDGKYITTGSIDNTAIIWDTKSGKKVTNLIGHSGAVFSVAFSPNDKYILTGSKDSTAILWNAKSGNKLFHLKGHRSQIITVSFSENGKYLMTGSIDGIANVWDVISGNVLYSLEGPKGYMSTVSFAQNDKLIITGVDKKIRIWIANKRKHLYTINGHQAFIMSINISNDGKFIISGDAGGAIKLWELNGGKELCHLDGHTSGIRSVVFHPKNKNIAISVSNDNTIRIWKIKLE